MPAALPAVPTLVFISLPSISWVVPSDRPPTAVFLSTCSPILIAPSHAMWRSVVYAHLCTPYANNMLLRTYEVTHAYFRSNSPLRSISANSLCFVSYINQRAVDLVPLFVGFLTNRVGASKQQVNACSFHHYVGLALFRVSNVF
jgi:hypothetical protein